MPQTPRRRGAHRSRPARQTSPREAPWLTRREPASTARGRALSSSRLNRLTGVGGMRVVSIAEASPAAEHAASILAGMTLAERRRLSTMLDAATVLPVPIGEPAEWALTRSLFDTVGRTLHVEFSTMSSGVGRGHLGYVTGTDSRLLRVFVGGAWLEVAARNEVAQHGKELSVHLGLELAMDEIPEWGHMREIDGVVIGHGRVCLVEAKTHKNGDMLGESTWTRVKKEFELLARWCSVAAARVDGQLTLVTAGLDATYRSQIQSILSTVAQRTWATPVVAVTDIGTHGAVVHGFIRKQNAP